jgi:hypothetical protein
VYWCGVILLRLWSKKRVNGKLRWELGTSPAILNSLGMYPDNTGTREAKAIVI